MGTAIVEIISNIILIIIIVLIGKTVVRVTKNHKPAKRPRSKTEKKRKKHPAQEDYPTSYIMIDTETTGLDPSKDKIVEISMIRVGDGQITDSLHYYINPGMPMPKAAQKVNGITDDFLRDALSLEDVREDIDDFIRGDDIIGGYNVTFDLRFLYRALEHPLENYVFDVMELAEDLLDINSYSLASVSRALGLGKQDHSASGDCILTIKVYKLLTRILEQDGGKVRTFQYIRR